MPRHHRQAEQQLFRDQLCHFNLLTRNDEVDLIAFFLEFGQRRFVGHHPHLPAVRHVVFQRAETALTLQAEHAFDRHAHARPVELVARDRRPPPQFAC